MVTCANASTTISARDQVVAVQQRTEIVFQEALNAMLGALEDLGATEASLTGLATTLSPEAMIRLKSCQSRFEELGAQLSSKAARSRSATQALQDLMRQTLNSLEDLRRLSRTATLVSLNAVVVSRTLGAEGGTIDGLAREMRGVLEDVGRLVAELGAKVALGRAGLIEVELQTEALENVTHEEAIPSILSLTQLVAARSRDRRLARSASHVSQRFRSLQGRVGDVVLHLQAGDSFRQRLEHVAAILALAEAPDLPMPAERLRRLAADQIRGALQDLRGAMHRASRNLRALASMASEIPRIGAIDLLRGRGEGGLVPMIEGAARIERMVAKVAGLGDQLLSASRGLSTTLDGAGRDAAEAAQFERVMTVMGLNAILLASRLGAGGRAMEEVARQQRDIARSIIEVMERLRRQIEDVVALAATLEGSDDETLVLQLRNAAEDACEVTALAKQVREHLSVTQAVRSSDDLATLMADAARTLDMFVRLASGLDDLAQALDQGPADESPLSPEARMCLDRIRTFYTMHAERQIHDRHVATAGPEPTRLETQALDDVFFT